MLPIRIIVHPTDFSVNSQNAWELACALACDYQACLYVIHVEPRTPSFSEFGAVPPEPADRRALERQLAQVRPKGTGIAVTRILLDGDEASEINRFAEKVHADLIVMGTHGRTGFGRLLMGSVAEEVLRRAPCPVLTVKTPLPARAEVPESCEAAVVSA